MDDFDNYNQYYHVLGVTAGCSWSDLRTSYKSLIHKWHPDRLLEQNVDPAHATAMIQELNHAYQQLKSYYQKHGQLPLSEYRKSSSKLQDSMYETAPIYPSPQVERDRKPAHIYQNPSFVKSVLNPLLFFGSCSVLLASYLWADYDAQRQQNSSRAHPNYQQRQLAVPGTHTSAEPVIKTLAQHGQTSSKKFFSNGSTMSEVVEIQGKPDRIEDDLWFYGTSVIRFYHGQVISWQNGIGHPLRVETRNNLDSK